MRVAISKVISRITLGITHITRLMTPLKLPMNVQLVAKGLELLCLGCRAWVSWFPALLGFSGQGFQDLGFGAIHLGSGFRV